MHVYTGKIINITCYKAYNFVYIYTGRDDATARRIAIFYLSEMEVRKSATQFCLVTAVTGSTVQGMENGFEKT